MMMTDEVLAVHAYEILNGHPPGTRTIGNHTQLTLTYALSPSRYVRDWRIAGALIEIMATKDGELGDPVFDDNEPNLARAFTQACVNEMIGVHKEKRPCPIPRA